jgi:23S rRNA (cytosine1962-C5)-methyltransferase
MYSGSEKIDTQAAMFANRLQKRLRHLKKWAQRTKTGVFRRYDRDIP